LIGIVLDSWEDLWARQGKTLGRGNFDCHTLTDLNIQKESTL